MTARKVRATKDPDLTKLDGRQTATTDSHLTVLDDIAKHVDGAFVLVVESTQ